MTGGSLGGGTYQDSAGFDLLQRPTDVKTTRSSGRRRVHVRGVPVGVAALGTAGQPEQIKEGIVGRGGSVGPYDLFKDGQGYVNVLPKNGQGERQYTGLRLRGCNVEYGVPPTGPVDPIEGDPMP
jgi:hypothetical protein